MNTESIAAAGPGFSGFAPKVMPETGILDGTTSACWH